jgi:hypothetical protein
LRIWFIAHVAVSDSVMSPEAPPPERPLPAVTEVTSPVPDRSGAHVTVPSVFTPMMKLPLEQVPATRFWISAAGRPPTASVFPEWIAYGTASIEIRGSIGTSSSFTSSHSFAPVNTVLSSALVAPMSVNSTPSSSISTSRCSFHTLLPPAAAVNSSNEIRCAPLTGLPLSSSIMRAENESVVGTAAVAVAPAIAAAASAARTKRFTASPPRSERRRCYPPCPASP